MKEHMLELFILCAFFQASCSKHRAEKADF